MLAPRVRAVLSFLLMVGALALSAPAYGGVAAVTAAPDVFKAAPTGVRDVLANDSGPAGNLRIASNTQPAHGKATCSALGACFYQANGGFTGTDTFKYVVKDGAATGTGTVTVTVSKATSAGAFAARDDDVATQRNTAKTFNVLANDTAAGKKLASNGNPKHGTVSCTAGGACTYKPAAGYSGSDGFVYTMQEPGTGRQAPAAAHILVGPAGMGFGLSVGGAAINGVNGAITPGGQGGWSLNTHAFPAGISGQELSAIGAPSGTASTAGEHSLTPGSLHAAKGWTAGVDGNGAINYAAGKGALLGDSFTQTFPKPLPPISQGTGGDGHVPILVGSKVFAFYHHSHPTSVTCVDRATGAACPGYPKFLNFTDDNQSNDSFNGFGTDNIPGPGAVVGSKIYTRLLGNNNYAQSSPLGLFCWDTATDSTCGYTIVNRYVQNTDPMGSAPVLAGGKMWMAGPDGKLYCVDPDTGAACGSLSDGLATNMNPSFGIFEDIITHDNRVYVGLKGDKVACIDAVTKKPCSGWATPKSFNGNANLITEHDAAGTATGLCVVAASTGECVSDANPGTRRAISNFVQVADYYEVTVEAEVGNRTLVGSLNRGGLGCYDWATRAPCKGGDYGSDGWISQSDSGSGLPSAYGAVSDGACAIALGDPGQVYTVDPAGTSPCTSLGSGTDRTTIDLRDQRCDGTVGGAAWRNVTLADTDSTEMDSIVVTVRDAATGQVLKSGEMIKSKTLDLSGISAAQHPRITIDATAKSKAGNKAWDDGIPPRIRVNWSSDPQTTCLQTTGANACGSTPATVTVAGALSNGAGSEAHLGLLRKACSSVKGETAKSCAGKRVFRIHLRFKGKKAKKITVTVKGKKQKLIRMKPRPVFKVDLRKYARQRVVVKIRILTKKGKVLKGTRVYHPCTKKRPGRGFRF
jgi:Bacterial Ig domain/PQQ-like domain